MINLPVRIFLFVVAAVCFLYGAYIIGLLLVAFLCVQFAAYEYIGLAFCIDCYFSPEPIMFWYTVVITGMVLAGIVLHPRILRNQTYD